MNEIEQMVSRLFRRASLWERVREAGVEVTHVDGYRSVKVTVRCPEHIGEILRMKWGFRREGETWTYSGEEDRGHWIADVAKALGIEE